jgi:hypothetical protein
LPNPAMPWVMVTRLTLKSVLSVSTDRQFVGGRDRKHFLAGIGAD